MSDFEIIAKKFPIARISGEEFQIKLRAEKDFVVYIENKKDVPSQTLPTYLNITCFPCFIRFANGYHYHWLHGSGIHHDVNQLESSLDWFGGISDSAKKWRSLPFYYVCKTTETLFNIESLI